MEKDNLEILLEDIRGKFDLVLEGHEVLHKEIKDTRKEVLEKIAFVDFKLETVSETLNKKMDAVAADLSAHRQYTEAHPSVYKVKESDT